MDPHKIVYNDIYNSTKLGFHISPSELDCLVRNEDAEFSNISVGDSKILTYLLSCSTTLHGGLSLMQDGSCQATSGSVVINDFEIMTFPVTNYLFYLITHTCPSFHKGSTRPVENLNWLDCIIFANLYSQYFGMRPAYQYDPDARMQLGEDETAKIFADSVRLIDKNSWRLATEAEWEYATCCPKGLDDTHLHEGWDRSNSDWRTHAVGQKPPNPNGLYDMHGNTWDWTWNWFSPYDQIGGDGFGPLTGIKKTGRGGCWYHTPAECHPKVRRTGTPNSYCNSHGARIVRSLK